MYGIYPRCYEAKPSNPEGIPYTTASEKSMWLGGRQATVVQVYLTTVIHLAGIAMSRTVVGDGELQEANTPSLGAIRKRVCDSSKIPFPPN